MPAYSLQEYETLVVPATAITPSQGYALWQQYGKQIGVTFPSPKTDGNWHLSGQGWVGHLALTPHLKFHLLPKVPLHALADMLCYAYGWHWLDGLVHTAESPTHLYTILAHRLAQGVLQLVQQGLQHDYQPQLAPLTAVRGRLKLPTQPPHTRHLCHTHTHTADIPHNQLLAHTLHLILQSQLCPTETPHLQRALRTLAHISPRPFTPADIDNLTYTRLNQANYQPLHALCRFFLAHTLPNHRAGHAPSHPFLINMPLLFEQFIAAWLIDHLPAPYTLHIQPQIHTSLLPIRPDLVIYNQPGQAVMVLDTKYKNTNTAVASDIHQISFYAQALNCPEAILIYPKPLAKPLAASAKNVRLRTLTFNLGQPIPQAGKAFLKQLLNG